MLKNKFVMLLLLILVLGVSSYSQAQPGQKVPDEILVVPMDNVPDKDFEDTYKAHGQKVKAYKKSRVHRVKIRPGQSIDEVIARLKKNPKIKYVEPNYHAYPQFVPNDQSYSQQWHHPLLNSPLAWNLTLGDPKVIIAVIDSGADPSHSDLLTQYVPGYNFVSDNNTLVDTMGHGTVTSGTAAAAINNNLGVTGVCGKCSIMPLVIIQSTGSATFADLAESMRYATDNGARIVSMSLGWTSSSNILQDAVNYVWSRNGILIAAAGNYNTNSSIYPAGLNNVLSVGATDKNDVKASFSNYGSTIDVWAPGVGIWSTSKGNGYGSHSGTSISCPIVAGLAGLMLSKNPMLSNADVVKLILDNTYKTTGGLARINIAKSLAAVPVLPTMLPAPPFGLTISGGAQ